MMKKTKMKMKMMMNANGASSQSQNERSRSKSSSIESGDDSSCHPHPVHNGNREHQPTSHASFTMLCLSRYIEYVVRSFVRSFVR